MTDKSGAAPWSTRSPWPDQLVFPVLLGAGKRLFSDADKDKQMLRLVDSRTYTNGLQKQVFDVLR